MLFPSTRDKEPGSEYVVEREDRPVLLTGANDQNIQFSGRRFCNCLLDHRHTITDAADEDEGRGGEQRERDRSIAGTHDDPSSSNGSGHRGSWRVVEIETGCDDPTLLPDQKRPLAPGSRRSPRLIQINGEADWPGTTFAQRQQRRARPHDIHDDANAAATITDG